MKKRKFLSLCLSISMISAFLPAHAAEETTEGPKILLSSVSQEVNIGDIAQGPGALALIEKYIPNAQVKLLAAGATKEVQDMINERFPDLVVQIIHGKFGSDGKATVQSVIDACEWADYLVQGSGPGVTSDNIRGFIKHSGGKPYGILGVTYSGSESAKEMINGADFCYFRDSVSLNKALSDGLTCPVMQYGPDTAFAFDIKDNEKAEAFMQANGLEEGKYMCLIPRYRATPYWEIKNVAKNEASDKTNQEYKEHDNGPLRAAAVKLVLETGMKVVVCPEDATQMKLGKDVIIDKLDEELAQYEDLTDEEKEAVKSKFVWHEEFWLPDEATALYSKSAGVFGNEMHSPIISIGNGIPATVGRWSGQTSKGLMWKDIGLGDWLFDMDKDEDIAKVAPTVLDIAKNPTAAKAKQEAALKVVQGCQEDMFKTFRYFLTGEGSIQTEHTSKIGGDSDLGIKTGNFNYHGTWQKSGLAGAAASLKLFYSSKPGAYAKWIPGFDTAGDVKVQVYRVPHSSRGVQTYEIHHNGKTDTYNVDFNTQSGEESAWVDLGTYDFAGVENEYVKLPVTVASPATQLSEVRFITNPGTENEEIYWVPHKINTIVNDTFDDSTSNNRLNLGWTLYQSHPLQVVQKPFYNAQTGADETYPDDFCVFNTNEVKNKPNTRNFDPMTGIVTIEYDFRFDKVPQGQLRTGEIGGKVGSTTNSLLTAFSILPTTTSSGETLVQLNVPTAKTRVTYNGLETKTWYHIKAQFDTEANTFSLWLDNKALAANKPLYNSVNAENISAFSITPAASTAPQADLYVDNILIYAGEQGQLTTLSSDIYKVRTVASTIENIPYGTDVATLTSNLIPAAGATISSITDSEGNAKTEGMIKTGDKLTVIPQDQFNNNKKTVYTITVNAPDAALALDPSSVVFTNAAGQEMTSELLALNKGFAATVDIKNFTGAPKDANLYLAIFNENGSLSSIAKQTTSIPIEGTTAGVLLNLSENMKVGQTLRLFVWDENLYPILYENKSLKCVTPLEYAESLKIEAEDFTEKHDNVNVQQNKGDAAAVTGSFDNGRWLKYNINFSMQGYSRFTARLGSGNGGSIEIRLGSTDGTLIGTLTVDPTGTYIDYSEQSTTLDDSVIGSHDVYLVAKGGTGVANLDWIKFDNEEIPLPEIVNDNNESISYYNMESIQASGYENGDYHVGTEDGCYFETTFSGSGIDIMAPLSTDGATADVYIDDVKAGTINSITTSENMSINRTVFTKAGLTNKTHTIKVVKTGGTNLVLDAIKVYTRAIKVACIGDSITAGTNLTGTQKYPYQLGQLLGAGYNVQNYGVSGATARKEVSRGNPYWDQVYFTTSKNANPDIVIIMLGTNDAKNTDFHNKTETYKSDLIELINTYKNLPSRPRVYVNTSPSVYTAESSITDYNERVSIHIRNLIIEAAQETNCPVIDILTATAGNSALMQADGIHPTVDGASVIANTIYNSLPCPVTN